MNFQSKFLCRFRETSDYFLCILVVVCHKSSIISKIELAYQNIFGLTDLNWLALNKFSPSLLCTSYSLSRISEGIRQDHREKNRELWRQEHSPVSFRFQPQTVVLSWLMLSFLYARQIRVWRSGRGTLVSVGCSIALPCSVSKAFLKSTNII